MRLNMTFEFLDAGIVQGIIIDLFIVENNIIKMH